MKPPQEQDFDRRLHSSTRTLVSYLSRKPRPQHRMLEEGAAESLTLSQSLEIISDLRYFASCMAHQPLSRRAIHLELKSLQPLTYSGPLQMSPPVSRTRDFADTGQWQWSGGRRRLCRDWWYATWWVGSWGVGSQRAMGYCDGWTCYDSYCDGCYDSQLST